MEKGLAKLILIMIHSKKVSFFYIIGLLSINGEVSEKEIIKIKNGKKLNNIWNPMWPFGHEHGKE